MATIKIRANHCYLSLLSSWAFVQMAYLWQASVAWLEAQRGRRTRRRRGGGSGDAFERGGAAHAARGDAHGLRLGGDQLQHTHIRSGESVLVECGSLDPSTQGHNVRDSSGPNFGMTYHTEYSMTLRMLFSGNVAGLIDKQASTRRMRSRVALVAVLCGFCCIEAQSSVVCSSLNGPYCGSSSGGGGTVFGLPAAPQHAAANLDRDEEVRTNMRMIAVPIGIE